MSFYSFFFSLCGSGVLALVLLVVALCKVALPRASCCAVGCYNDCVVLLCDMRFLLFGACGAQQFSIIGVYCCTNGIRLFIESLIFPFLKHFFEHVF